jgi:hypothetical protein
MSNPPWAPMVAPPLPLRNDLEWDTCEHAYPRDMCHGYELHWRPEDAEQFRLATMFGMSITRVPGTLLNPRELL